MRILELVNSLEIGGAEKLVTDLSCALTAKGHSVYVACLRRVGPLAGVLETSGIEVIELRKDEGFSFRTARTLSEWARARRVDIMHTHNPLVHHYGALSARLAGVPVVVNTVHGPGNIRTFDASMLLFDLSCLWSDRVVPCCNAVAQHLKLRTFIAGRRPTVIYNGIQVNAFQSISPRNPDGMFVFGAVGRLAPVKDHMSLLEAFARVHKSYPNCRLDLLGDGPLRGILESRARALDISDFVQFLGSGLQVAQFLSKIDAFVMSSLSEGLPLTVLEAMASGLPVVATSVGAIPEMLDAAQCGWLSRPSDPGDLAVAMSAAVSASDLRERGARARSYVQKHYSVEQMTQGYEDLFWGLLNRQ
jgi:glycosyltransferase involved in cell wall biosynthesis